MENRKKILSEIMTNLNTMKNKMHFKIMQEGKYDRITHSQWFVLNIIESNRNIGIKEISKMLGITSSAATQLVDGLVENGYVVRKTNTKDRRSLQLYLSLQGQRHIAFMKKKYTKAMEMLFKTLSDGELQTYLALHKKILKNLHHE